MVDRIHINIGDWRIGVVMDVMRGFPSLINVNNMYSNR